MAELIGTKEASKICGVSEVTIWRWVKSGRLQPMSRLGKQVIFSREYIEREAQRIEATKQSKQEAVA